MWLCACVAFVRVLALLQPRQHGNSCQSANNHNVNGNTLIVSIAHVCVLANPAVEVYTEEQVRG